MKFTIPNILSMLRMALAPFFFILIISEDTRLQFSACIVFIIGAVTDTIDGWYARKYHKVTSLGKFIDPLADKILTTSAFIAFFILKIVPLWMVAVIILRDIFTTLLRIYAESVKKPVVTSYSAKVKTTIQMLFIVYLLLLIFIESSNLFPVWDEFLKSMIYSYFTYYFMFFLTILTLWTALEYIYQNKTILTNLYKELRNCTWI